MAEAAVEARFRPTAHAVRHTLRAEAAWARAHILDLDLVETFASGPMYLATFALDQDHSAYLLLPCDWVAQYNEEKVYGTPNG